MPIDSSTLQRVQKSHLPSLHFEGLSESGSVDLRDTPINFERLIKLSVWELPVPELYMKEDNVHDTTFGCVQKTCATPTSGGESFRLRVPHALPVAQPPVRAHAAARDHRLQPVTCHFPLNVEAPA